MNSKIERLSHAADEYEQQIDYSNLSPWMQQAFDKINGYSLTTQVQQSMQGRPRYATVEDAVRDMRERTGLDQYLKTSADRKADGTLTKSALQAIVDEVNVPEVIKNKPDSQEIVQFVKNRIQSSNGNIKVPEIQYDLFSTFQSVSAGDVEEYDVIQWLNTLVKDAKIDSESRQDYSNIGKIDYTSDFEQDDPFKNMSR